MTSTDITLLFSYLYWLRDRIASSAAMLAPEAFRSTAGATSRDLRATLVHELDIEIGWRERLRGSPREAWSGELSPETYPTLDTLLEHWRRDEAEMRTWLEALSADDLGAPVTVNDLDGYPMSYYLLHVVTHGIQELEDAAVLLGQAGMPARDIGFLHYADAAAGR